MDDNQDQYDDPHEHDDPPLTSSMPEHIRRRRIKVQGGRLYLPVAPRLIWFREDHPDWGILTDPLEINHDKQYAIFRCTIMDASGRIVATATKKEDVKGFGDFIEKAETGSVGRALAMCGYCTENDPELRESDVVDSPARPAYQQRPAQPQQPAQRSAPPARQAPQPAPQPAPAPQPPAQLVNTADDQSAFVQYCEKARALGFDVLDGKGQMSYGKTLGVFIAQSQTTNPEYLPPQERPADLPKHERWFPNASLIHYASQQLEDYARSKGKL